MNESEALLVVERGPVASLRYALQQEQVTIGRSAGNELVLADPEISRRHARVVRRADGYAVEDIGSTNGTFVNGQRISHLTLLQDGDTIDLGDTVRLRFVAAPVLPDAPPVPPLSERPTETLAAPAAGPAYPSPAAATPGLESPVYPSPAVPAPMMAAPPAPPAAAPVYPPPLYAPEPRRGRGLLIGCGLLVALLLVCAGTFLILDAYDQGRLLYCGAARPLLQAILDPLGFPLRTCP
jgi:hypothetical protein